MNYYELLQINTEASPEIIKAAYKTMAKKYHPDICGDNGKMMEQINEAYAVLSDPVRRHEYDMTLKADQSDYTSQPETNADEYKREYAPPPERHRSFAKKFWQAKQQVSNKTDSKTNPERKTENKSDEEMPLGCLGWIIGLIGLLIEGIVYVIELAWGIVLILIIIGFFTGHSQRLFGKLFDWVTGLIK